MVISQASPEARYEGTKRLHALGWLPPSCKRPEDQSADSVAALTPDDADDDL